MNSENSSSDLHILDLLSHRLKLNYKLVTLPKLGVISPDRNN